MLNLNIRNSKKKKKRLCISRGLRFRHFAEGNATITPACITINLKTAKDIEGKHQSPRLPEFYVVLSGDSVINFWLQHFPGCLALRCWAASVFLVLWVFSKWFRVFPLQTHPDHLLSENEKLYEWNYFC